jgi:hypothetical protein
MSMQEAVRTSFSSSMASRRLPSNQTFDKGLLAVKAKDTKLMKPIKKL